MRTSLKIRCQTSLGAIMVERNFVFSLMFYNFSLAVFHGLIPWYHGCKCYRVTQFYRIPKANLWIRWLHNSRGELSLKESAYWTCFETIPRSKSPNNALSTLNSGYILVTSVVLKHMHVLLKWANSAIYYGLFLKGISKGASGQWVGTSIFHKCCTQSKNQAETWNSNVWRHSVQHIKYNWIINGS